PVADVDDAGVLARALYDPRRRGREPAQVHFRRFVRAVFVPHRREDAELGDARHAADERENALIFLGREAVGGDQIGGDLRRGGAPGGGRNSDLTEACRKQAARRASHFRDEITGRDAAWRYCVGAAALSSATGAWAGAPTGSSAGGTSRISMAATNESKCFLASARSVDSETTCTSMVPMNNSPRRLKLTLLFEVRCASAMIAG